jgi:hypothetical protein
VTRVNSIVTCLQRDSPALRLHGYRAGGNGGAREAPNSQINRHGAQVENLCVPRSTGCQPVCPT